MDLFERAAEADPAGVPLAERMRPRTLDEVVGHRWERLKGAHASAFALKHDRAGHIGEMPIGEVGDEFK